MRKDIRAKNGSTALTSSGLIKCCKTNLMELLPIAGFTVKYSVKPTTITARKEDTWILIQVSGRSYTATVVHAKEEPWTPLSDAEAIAREMQVHGRAAIYGIQFSE